MNIDGKLKSKLLPFVLTIVIIVLDQITKMLIVRYVPEGTIGSSLLGDFLRITHIRNPGAAFGVGAGWSLVTRRVVFSVIPLICLAAVIAFMCKSEDLGKLLRWCIAGIVGGGMGNVIDRVFRPHGVVDFIDIKFFGIFGYDRWPTFNIADSAVVICAVILIVYYIYISIKEAKSKKSK